MGSVISNNDLLKITAPTLQRLYRDWDSRRRGRQFPERADFDVLDMRYILGNLSLMDVRYDPLRFRYRLHGTNIAQRIGTELTAKDLGAIPDLRHQEFAREHFEEVVERRAPVIRLRQHKHIDGRVFNCEVLVLPLSSNGTSIDMLMNAMVWD